MENGSEVWENNGYGKPSSQIMSGGSTKLGIARGTSPKVEPNEKKGTQV